MKAQFIIFSLFSLFISFSCGDKSDEKQAEAKGNYEDELYRDPKNYFKDCNVNTIIFHELSTNILDYIDLFKKFI